MKERVTEAEIEEGMMQLFPLLKRLLTTECRGCPFVDGEKFDIKRKSKLRKELCMDSLDVYEMTYFIEEEIGIFIPDEKANEFETIDDILRYLSKAGAPVS